MMERELKTFLQGWLVAQDTGFCQRVKGSSSYDTANRWFGG